MSVPNITNQRSGRNKSHEFSKNRKKPAILYNILLHKPYGVLCQFTDTEGRMTLSGLGSFPSDVYPAGRLDFDSEGLLLLTNDGMLKHLLLEPWFHHPRTYLVQVERVPTGAALHLLRKGIVIEGKKTLPAEVYLLSEEPALPDRPVPIRFRKNVPTAWLKICLREGRNRQVRKMTASVGHPALRLVRIAIANLTLEGLQPGEHREVSEAELKELKKILSKGNTKRKSPGRLLS